ncbi:MAG: hypothetical protein HWN66_00405 [Candidatus Helarchaeota archaeon]|nr:hypothetical protein [Candidatus Helarchaeota archaeon]
MLRRIYEGFIGMLAVCWYFPKMEFRLPTARSFISNFKSYTFAVHREGLDIRRSWNILFGTGSEDRENDLLYPVLWIGCEWTLCGRAY